jgi:NADH-quinone oxidoreductase subunit J
MLALQTRLFSLGHGLAQATAPGAAAPATTAPTTAATTSAAKTAHTSASAAHAVPLAPLVILVLCVLAGIATVLLLPARREASMRKIGGVALAAVALIFAATLLRWTAGSAAGHMGIYFWIFSAIALVGAVRVITHTKPVYSALYFVLSVFATAGLFLLLWAEFMAAALVLIYAGAILVTYVFVIMLAAEATSPSASRTGALAGLGETDTVSRDPLAAAVVGFALMGMLLFVIFDKAQPVPRAPSGLPPVELAAGGAIDFSGSTESLGRYLFERQLVNLELAGLILTIAMVGAIVIARKRVQPTEDELPGMPPIEPTTDVVLGPATPVDDDPHSIPVSGTRNPRQKVYPET